MVFAKTSKAAARLSEQIRKHEFEKTYLAVIHGSPIKPQATLEHYLKKDTEANKVMVYPRPVADGKQAILGYQLIETKNNRSLVKVNLQTGRSHQIRAQFATIGHPLYGDQKYGMEWNKVGQQLALWSVRISFSHPVKHQPVNYPSYPPAVFPWSDFQIAETIFSF